MKTKFSTRTAVIFSIAGAFIGASIVATAPATAATGGSGPTLAWCTTHPQSTPKWVDRSYQEISWVHGPGKTNVKITCDLQPAGTAMRPGLTVYYGPQG